MCPFNLCPKCGETYRIGLGCPSCGRDELKIKKIIKEPTKRSYGPKTCHKCGKNCYGYYCGECKKIKGKRVTAIRRTFKKKTEENSVKKFFGQFNHKGIIKETFNNSKKGEGIIEIKEDGSV